MFGSRWKSQDAVAIITGASSGIGQSLCHLLAQGGASVVVVARRQDRLAALREKLGDCVHPVAGDITDPSTREQVLETATSIRNGEVDLLVNNAGVGAYGPFAEALPQRMRDVMEVNFFAPVELTRLLIPALRQGRRSVICNVGSVLGHRAVPLKSEYCASKFAIHGWSDALRAELAGDGIQVTLVSPSTTRSDFFESMIQTEAEVTPAKLGAWPPERVAKAALHAIRARRSEVICSLGGKALVYADRIAPPMINAILRRSIQST